MDDVMDMKNPEAFLERLQRIYEEREEQYRISEEQYRRKNAALQEKINEIAASKKEMDEQRHLLQELQESIEKQKQELTDERAAMEEKKAEAERLSKEAQEKERNLLLKYNLKLEEVRTQELKLRRMKEEYEYKLSLMDHGIPMEMENPEGYIPRHDHEAEVSRLKDALSRLQGKLEALQEELETLAEENNQLRAERTGFMKRITELNSRIKNQTIRRTVDAEAIPESDAGTEKESSPEGAGTGDENPDSIEELTAEVLINYLEKNEPEAGNISVRHSDLGEQLHAEWKGLAWHFLFTDPPSFDISAPRKNTARLRKVLERQKELHPEAEFAYEDGTVYVSGYFDPGMAPYELMERIRELSGCFRLE